MIMCKYEKKTTLKIYDKNKIYRPQSIQMNVNPVF